MMRRKTQANEEKSVFSWRRAVLLYPLAAGAVAVNAFFLSLMLQVFDLPVLSTLSSIVIGLILGVPLAVFASTYFGGLIKKAEENTT